MTWLFIVLSLLTAFALTVLLVPMARNRTIALRQRQYIISGIALAYALLSFGLYGWLGAPYLLPLIEERDQRVTALSKEITANLDKVKANPDDLGAWVVLGTDFLETGQLDSAVAAFKQAVVLSGGDPVLILAYTKAQVMQADGKVTDEAKKGLEIILMIQPENPDARYFMALRKLQDGQTSEAMADMKALYKSLPPDSALKAMIDRQIGRNPQ